VEAEETYDAMDSNVAVAKADDMMLLVMVMIGEKEENRF
jgi:hypothetical protein